MTVSDATRQDRAVHNVKQLNALKPESATYEVRDASSTGLRLRVSPQGRMTWFYRYKSPETKKTVKLTLGVYVPGRAGEPQAGMGLAEARARWAELRRDILDGKDPKRAVREQKRAAVERVTRDQQRTGQTVSVLIQAYVDTISGEKKSWREDWRILKRYVEPELGTRSVFDITRANIRNVLDPIRERGAKVQANRVLACTRAMFNWAMYNDWPGADCPVVANPCSGLRMEKEQSRDRHLNDIELRVFLAALDNYADRGRADYLRFVLATGCRIGEAAGMEWSHLFGDEWRQPETKNGYSHAVYLSDYALAILGRRESGKSQYVWANPGSNSGHIRVDAVSKSLNAVLFGVEIESFTPHDLRRTLATWLGGQQVDEIIHDRMLNHQSGGIRRVYNVSRYNAPARQWWNRWGEHLQGLSSENVVSLDRNGLAS